MKDRPIDDTVPPCPTHGYTDCTYRQRLANGTQEPTADTIAALMDERDRLRGCVDRANAIIGQQADEAGALRDRVAALHDRNRALEDELARLRAGQ